MATDPVLKWKKYAQTWMELRGKLEKHPSTVAERHWDKIKKIDKEIEKLEVKFKKSIPDAYEKGVAGPKLSEYEKHREVSDVLKDFEKNRLALEKAIEALDAYCAECKKAVNEVFKITDPLAKDLRKHPPKLSGGDAKTTKAYADARSAAEVVQKESEAMFKDLNEASKYQSRPGAYLREFGHPAQNKKIIAALFDRALKKLKVKENDAELPAPVEAQMRKSSVDANKVKKLIDKSCQSAEHAWGVGPDDEADALKHLENAKFQARKFEEILKKFDRIYKKYKHMITAKKNIAAVEDALNNLRDMPQSSWVQIRKTERDLAERRKKKMKEGQKT